MYQSADFDYLLVSQKQLRAFNCFWIGFLIYTVTSLLAVLNFITSFMNIIGLQSIGALLFLGSSIFLIHFKFENKFLKFSFLLYIFWLLYIIARGFSLNAQFLGMMITDDYTGIFPFFTPLLLLFPQKIILYKRLFQVITAAAVIYLILAAIDIKEIVNRDITSADNMTVIENIHRRLGAPSAFLLLAYSYLTKKRKYFAWFIIFLEIIFAIIKARRGMLFTLTTPLLFTGFIYFQESKRKMTIVLGSTLLIIFIAAIGVIFYSQSSFFNSFQKRIDDDTRTGVEQCLYDDFKVNDWIMGKGISGEYYCPSAGQKSITGYRAIIETDYLNIILKGGLVSLSLFLLVTLPAAIKGIFYSSNNLSKAAGFWILVWLMNLYPNIVVNFNMNYLLVWIAVGICYNKKIRSIPDEVLKLYFSRLAIVANQN